MISFNDKGNLLNEKIELPYTYNELNELITNKELPGSKDWTGWYDDLKSDNLDILDQLEVIKNFRSKAKVMVVIGIGGSYLGSKAIYEALKQDKDDYQLLFAGINLSSDYTQSLLDYCKDNDFVVCYITKSGTTLEPAISFRLFKDLLISKYGKDCLKDRCIIITGQNNQLREYALSKDIVTFDVPETTGGRYSVFSSVGLVPLSFLGIDVSTFLKSAKQAIQDDLVNKDNSIAYRYACNRYEQYMSGNKVEAYVIYLPQLHYLLEWNKQLFGESEGKEGKGLLPISLSNTSDLHSLGQFVQDGSKILFETVIKVNNEKYQINIPYDEDNFDNLNQYQKIELSTINNYALEGTKNAHLAGGVSNLEFTLDKIDESSLGYFMASMLLSCMYSGYFLKLNPFDQPGVEFYKKEIVKILNASDK